MKEIETVGDLRRLLRDLDDDTALEVAPTPDVNGWTSNLLSCTHREDGLVVLCLSENTVTTEERDLVFRNSQGDEVRPV